MEAIVDCMVVDALVLMSGADQELPLGFPHEPKVTFLCGSEKLGTASTCELQL